MKILLIAGPSGSGKSTIASELCRNNPNYHLIMSYTDRPRRQNEFDHIFVQKRTMDYIPMKRIVAYTKIDGYRYCALYEQFIEDKINVYVVDAFGMEDTLRAFPDAEIISVFIDRKNIYIDATRKNRNIKLPPLYKMTCTIDNNKTIEDAVIKLMLICEYEDSLIFKISNHTN